MLLRLRSYTLMSKMTWTPRWVYVLSTTQHKGQLEARRLITLDLPDATTVSFPHYHICCTEAVRAIPRKYALRLVRVRYFSSAAVSVVGHDAGSAIKLGAIGAFDTHSGRGISIRLIEGAFWSRDQMQCNARHLLSLNNSVANLIERQS
jgi:hypothetical protein